MTTQLPIGASPQAPSRIKHQAMAEKIIVYWRDIPAQVLIQKGRKKERRELPERFIQAVDAAAMKVGAKDSDAYLAEW